MTRTFLAFSILAFNLNALAIQIGQPAPEFSLTDSTGKTRSLKDFKDKLVVLEWYNKDCPFVRKHYDSKNMQNLQTAEKKRGVEWLQIISSAPGNQGYLEPKEAVAQVKKEGAVVTATLLDKDGKVGKAYEARTTPHMYVINQKGVLVYMGAIDSVSSPDKEDIKGATNYVKAAIDETLANQPVTVASTTAYGCSVKYAAKP